MDLPHQDPPPTENTILTRADADTSDREQAVSVRLCEHISPKTDVSTNADN